MRWGLALLTGVLLWILIFVEVSTFFAAGIENYYYVHYIILVFLVMLCSLLYFRGSRGGAKEGLVLGIIYLIIGLVLDLAITVPFFLEGDYMGFFNNFLLLLGFFEILALTIIFGSIFRKKRVRTFAPQKFERAKIRTTFKPSPRKIDLSELKEQVIKTPEINEEKKKPEKTKAQKSKAKSKKTKTQKSQSKTSKQKAKKTKSKTKIKKPKTTAKKSKKTGKSKNKTKKKNKKKSK